MNDSPNEPAQVEVVSPFHDGSRRSNIVLSLFCLGVFLSLSCIVFDVRQFDLCARVVRGDATTDQDFESNGRQQFGIRLAMFAQYLALVIAFFMWIYRAHKNLPALGATGLEFSPKGAVGWYFAPLFNLFKPYQVMREIYNASDPNDAPTGGDIWRSYNSPVLLKLWWGLFVLMNMFTNSSTRLNFSAETPVDFQAASMVSIVSKSIAIAAYLPAIWLVWSVNRRQTIRAAILVGSR